MSTENTNLFAQVTKLELQVRTRFLKLMLSTQNTDKFVALVDQYLNRFPLAFQNTESTIQSPPAKSSESAQKNTGKTQQKPAKPPSKENTGVEKTSQQSPEISKSGKLSAMDRRTIRRSLPVYVRNALVKTTAPQRTDFLNRLEKDPVRALSRSKNSAVIFKHPRLGNISAGYIRQSFANIDRSSATKSGDDSKPIPESEKLEEEREALIQHPVSKATQKTTSSEVQSTSSADVKQKSDSAEPKSKPTKPSSAKKSPASTPTSTFTGPTPFANFPARETASPRVHPLSKQSSVLETTKQSSDPILPTPAQLNKMTEQQVAPFIGDLSNTALSAAYRKELEILLRKSKHFDESDQFF